MPIDEIPTSDFTSLVEGLSLARLGDDAEAGLMVTSLPWPRMPALPVCLAGRPTHQRSLGHWPGSGHPRRLLLTADSEGDSPAEARLTSGASARHQHRPTAEMEVFARSEEPSYMWERSRLRISWGDRSVGLALGLRTAGELHWWEACRLVVVEDTDRCLTVEMGGGIPCADATRADRQGYQTYTDPYLHKHNWLNGHLYARLHRNGVCEFFARHLNAKFVDDGLPLHDVRPVVGIDAGPAQPDATIGVWDGSQQTVDVGGLQFDFSQVAPLATVNQPGELSWENEMLVWQPYSGAELFGGQCPEQRTGDPFIVHAEDKVFPRGMARTLRFSVSLSSRSPTVARYLAPAWWYGLCEEFVPAALLPVTAEDDDAIAASQTWLRDHIVRGGFEDGSIPRHTSRVWATPDGNRHEPGWEGELPYAQFLTAWGTGNASDYADAMRCAYYCTDVTVDHAMKLVRMEGFPPHAFALPKNRMQGAIAAYLENGDPYLLRIAQAVTDNSHWMHLDSWPRLAVGRDAMYLRSAVLLYRYLGDEHYRQMAFDGAMTVVLSQRDNGSFGDQGGGTGVHAWMGYFSKPWMGLLALAGVLDYLELFPGTEVLHQAVIRFGDWLMSERWFHGGATGWSYQHDYNGMRRYVNPSTGEASDLPTPGPLWHQDNLGRLLGYCTFSTGDPAYLQAWAESYDAQWKKLGPGYLESLDFGAVDHTVSAALQFIPWIETRRWNVRWTNNRAVAEPIEAAFQPGVAHRARAATPGDSLYLERS